MKFDYDNLTEEESKIFSLSSSEDPNYRTRVKCHECGKSETLVWNALVNDGLKKLRLCFDCEFWTHYVELIDDPNVVRVGHQHFVIGDTEATGYLRGFGGRAFRIRFFDGRIVESTNLWSQGDISERFWDRLPDNAELIADPIEWDELVKQYEKEV